MIPGFTIQACHNRSFQLSSLCFNTLSIHMQIYIKERGHHHQAEGLAPVLPSKICGIASTIISHPASHSTAEDLSNKLRARGLPTGFKSASLTRSNNGLDVCKRRCAVGTERHGRHITEPTLLIMSFDATCITHSHTPVKFQVGADASAVPPPEGLTSRGH